MYKNLLIPTDGSEFAWKAVEHGMAFAKEIGAKITVLRVTLPFHVFTLDPQVVGDTADQYKKRVQEDTAKLFRSVTRTANAAGVACETVQIEHEHPYQGIIDTASSKGCDLIVMASHGRRGVTAILLGSETVKVLTHSKIPVLVHR
jgi:nucleotide-binding universal stress UspA family protein